MNLFYFSIFLCITAYVVRGEIDDPTPAPCDQMHLLTCFLPIVAYAMSDEAQRLTPAGSSGTISQTQFTELCEIVQPAAQCFQNFTSACVARNHTDVHIAADGGVHFMKFCQKPDAFNDARLIFECSHQLKQEHQQCSGRMKSAIPQDVDTGNPGQILERPNALRDLCCHLKTYDTCFMPQVRSKCSQPAARANENFLHRIYSSFHCIPHLTNCPPS